MPSKIGNVLTNINAESLSTGWCVITGAPCSGKSAVINVLEAMGKPVIHETARQLIQEHLDAGGTLAEMRHGAANRAFQRNVLDRKADIHRRLPPEARIFLDRGLPDSIGYFRLHGIDVVAPLAESRKYRYRHVFFFDRLPTKTDAVRNEDDATAHRLGELILNAYESLGYSPVRVPVMPVRERAAMVLAHVGDASS